jgi:PEGA domain
MVRASLLALALVFSSGTGCAAFAFGPVQRVAVPGPALEGQERTSLTVVLAADVPAAATVEATLRARFGDAFDLSFAPAPTPPPSEPPARDLSATLAAARRAYIDAEFRVCIERIAADALPFELAQEGDRQAAARVLFWRIACRVGAGSAADARPDARALATLALDVPADVDAVSPEVEALIAEARREIAGRPRASLRVEASAGASVSVDGRAPACVTPCTVDLPPGDHVVRVEAPGFVPTGRRVRLEPSGGTARFTLLDAPPELAARQWSIRYARGESLDSAASVTLLARAVRARRLALLTWETGRLRGALVVDGGIAARAERHGQDASALAPTLLRDLLVRGQLVEPAPSLVERPLFWVAVGGAVVVAAGVTALLLYDPPVTTEVGF